MPDTGLLGPTAENVREVGLHDKVSAPGTLRFNIRQLRHMLGIPDGCGLHKRPGRSGETAGQVVVPAREAELPATARLADAQPPDHSRKEESDTNTAS